MDAAELQEALQKYRRYNPDPSFPVVPDSGGNLARAFGPWEKLPQTYLLAGRPFPRVRSDVAPSAPATVVEEAPSIRKQQNLDDSFRSAMVQGDSAFMAGISTVPCRGTWRPSKCSRGIYMPWCAWPRFMSVAANPSRHSSTGGGSLPCGLITLRPSAFD